jgi:D-sedoheptulose 7-phosphate isomerase
MSEASVRRDKSGAQGYAARLGDALSRQDWSKVDALADLMREAWREKRSVFVCGNGGSAVNALHWATDFLYPVSPGAPGMRIMALPANPGVLSCLGNDISFRSIFSQQLHSLGAKGDLLIVLSGSGNSDNILAAIDTARELGIKTVGLFGFQGGKALSMVDFGIHFPVDDMQIAEDLQLVVNHMVMRALLEPAAS